MGGKRLRPAPERWGSFAQEATLEELLLLSEDDLSGEEPTQPLRKARRTSRTGRCAGAGAAGVEAPPPAPAARLLLDVLTLDPLLAALTAVDAVRCLPLVARDVASTVVALGLHASAPVTGALWSSVHGAALRHPALALDAGNDGAGEGGQQPEGAAPDAVAEAPAGQEAAAGQEADAAEPAGAEQGPAEPALAAVQRLCAEHPDRQARIPLNEAKWHYRLPGRELEVLPFELGKYRRHMLSLLEVKAVAHRRHGDAAGLETAGDVARERQQRRHQTHAAKVERHRQQLTARLAEEGVPEDLIEVKSSWPWGVRAQYATYMRHGGSSQELQALVDEVKVACAKEMRSRDVRGRLDAEGLKIEYYGTTVQSWIAQPGDQTIAALLDDLRQRKEEKAQQAKDIRQRRGQLEACLRANELSHLMHHRACREYVQSPLEGQDPPSVVLELFQVLDDSHQRLAQLVDRMVEENLMPSVMLHTDKVGSYLRQSEGKMPWDDSSESDVEDVIRYLKRWT